jgi:hypothetical protein
VLTPTAVAVDQLYHPPHVLTCVLLVLFCSVMLPVHAGLWVQGTPDGVGRDFAAIPSLLRDSCRCHQTTRATEFDLLGEIPLIKNFG